MAAATHERGLRRRARGTAPVRLECAGARAVRGGAYRRHGAGRVRRVYRHHPRHDVPGRRVCDLSCFGHVGADDGAECGLLAAAAGGAAAVSRSWARLGEFGTGVRGVGAGTGAVGLVEVWRALEAEFEDRGVVVRGWLVRCWVRGW